MVIRKADIAVSDAEVKRMQEQQLDMAEEFQDMKEDIQQIAALLKGRKDEERGRGRVNISGQLEKNGDQKGANISGQLDKKRSSPEENRYSPERDIIIKDLDLNKNTLSLNKVISGFFRGVGQNKISRVKRERALNIAKKLRFGWIQS
jgi:hypothetical protein